MVKMLQMDENSPWQSSRQVRKQKLFFSWCEVSAAKRPGRRTIWARCMALTQAPPDDIDKTERHKQNMILKRTLTNGRQKPSYC